MMVTFGVGEYPLVPLLAPGRRFCSVLATSWIRLRFAR